MTKKKHFLIDVVVTRHDGTQRKSYTIDACFIHTAVSRAIDSATLKRDQEIQSACVTAWADPPGRPQL